MGRDSGNPWFAVVGAGPYGLAVASHLRAAGVEVRAFGKAMDFWDGHMPRGMLLRSPRAGSHIADPGRALTLDRYEEAHGVRLPERTPMEDYVRYGRWFQGQAVPDLDPRLVSRVERSESGFGLTLEDGERLGVDGVVIAAGIAAFPHVPAPLASLPPELASHTSARANRDLGRFAGRHVIVVGGGQSAAESAALLAEAGARVEILVRRLRLRFLTSRPVVDWLTGCRANPFRAPAEIGPVGINWLVEHPTLFTLLPRRLQDRMACRAVRPAASAWLRPRVRGIPVRPGRQVIAAAAHGDRVRLRLSDGTEREADHVLLGTGYRVALTRYGFLADDLLASVRTVHGYPVLNGGFESSVPGLYFVGAPAAHSFGPLCRFVAGTGFTAVALTNFVRRAAARRPRAALLTPVRS